MLVPELCLVQANSALEIYFVSSPFDLAMEDGWSPSALPPTPSKPMTCVEDGADPSLQDLLLFLLT